MLFSIVAVPIYIPNKEVLKQKEGTSGTSRSGAVCKGWDGKQEAVRSGWWYCRMMKAEKEMGSSGK